MYMDRLKKIRDHLLNNVKDERFYLGTWAGITERPFKGDKDLSCGTTACAMGHACTIPEFQELGLKLIKTYKEDVNGNITFNDYYGFDAVQKFLGMNDNYFLVNGEEVTGINACDYLFDPDSYDDENSTSKSEVIARISSFIEENEKAHKNCCKQ